MVTIQRPLTAKHDPHMSLFPVSRTESTLTSLSSHEKSPFSSAESSPKAQTDTKKAFNLRNAKPLQRNKRNTISGETSSKVQSNRAMLLLEKYRTLSSMYRDEEFTQQACSFIAKIASEQEIPDSIKGKFSLYYILVSITKIFMLNEYELTLLSCVLEHCDWDIAEVVHDDEENLLTEFPCSLEVEITDESKKLILYLLVLAYTLKSHLNEKEEIESIKAYCEKICKNFHELSQRTPACCTKKSINFSQLEINKKFRSLAKKDNKEPFMKILKDYNMVVESILRLTGSHTLKPKAKTAQHQSSKAKNKIKILEDTHTGESTPDTDVFFSAFDNNNFKLSTALDLEFPQDMAPYSIDDTYENLKREADLENFEEEGSVTKKVKYNENTCFFPGVEQMEAEQSSAMKIEMSISKRFEPEDFLDMVNLSRTSSIMPHQMQDDIPSFSRLNSTFSMFGVK